MAWSPSISSSCTTQDHWQLSCIHHPEAARGVQKRERTTIPSGLEMIWSWGALLGLQSPQPWLSPCLGVPYPTCSPGRCDTSNTVNLLVAPPTPYECGCWLSERGVMELIDALQRTHIFILIGIQLLKSAPPFLQLIPEGSLKPNPVNLW